MGKEKTAEIECCERVVIVGGGPVGLALSFILARYEVPSIVLEAREGPTQRDESRAIVWMPRGLELLEWLGIRDRFESVGVTRTTHEFRTSKRKLLELSFQQLESPYPYTLQLPQHDTEKLLETAAIETGLVDIRRSHRVLDIGESNGRATVTVEAPSGTYSISAPWAVGTDGAKSTVRKLLGIQTKWRDYGTNSAVADFEMETPLPLDASSIVLDPKRPYGFFYFAPGRWRFIYRLNEGEDRQEMTTEQAATKLLLEKRPDVTIKRFLWASAFRLGQGQSESYRKGRWILAGDAAHAMGPSAGAGMMIGLLGAWRLGWRLAQAFRNHALTEMFLKDYEREQRAGSDEIQDTNAMIFKNMAMKNPLAASVRSCGLKLAASIPGVASGIAEKEALVNQVLPVGDSMDFRMEGPWKKIQTCGRWVAGKRMPYIKNTNSATLLLPNQLGHTFVSIGRRDALEEKKCAAFLMKSFPLQADFIEAEGAYRNEKSESIVFALIRPDQHIAAIIEMKS